MEVILTVTCPNCGRFIPQPSMEWDSPSISFDEKSDLPELDFINPAKEYCYECTCGARVYVRKQPKEVRTKKGRK